MSYEERNEIDSRNAICPYCGHSYQVECEDYTNQDERVEEECESCGKTYLRWTEYSVDHWTETIDEAKAKEVRS